jgi:hypothetical protein
MGGQMIPFIIIVFWLSLCNLLERIKEIIILGNGAFKGFKVTLSKNGLL